MEVRVTRNHARDVYDAAEFKVADMKQTVKEIQSGAVRGGAKAVLSQMDSLRYPAKRDFDARAQARENKSTFEDDHRPGLVQRIFSSPLSKKVLSQEAREQERMAEGMSLNSHDDGGNKPGRTLVRYAETTASQVQEGTPARSRSPNKSPRRQAVKGVLSEVFKSVSDDDSAGRYLRETRTEGQPGILDGDRFKHGFKGWWA